jgi:glycosyltransferase involved in cell wall biosynthesis
MALRTILANDHPSFELILVDQSFNGETSEAVATFSDDPRYHYVRSRTQGVSRARNEGAALARGALILFTDDDCSVPSDWIRSMETVFSRDEQIGVVYCNVEASEHDKTLGFIPDYVRTDSALIRTMREKCSARGIGAGIGIRASAMAALGGFDEGLGPGARFPACEDRDIALRAILSELWVFETHETFVVHHGFRTWREGKDLTRRDWVGIGAACAKPLKCGRWRALIVAGYEFSVALRKPVTRLLGFSAPVGFRQGMYFLQGFSQALRAPVDRRLIKFRTEA